MIWFLQDQKLKYWKLLIKYHNIDQHLAIFKSLIFKVFGFLIAFNFATP